MVDALRYELSTRTYLPLGYNRMRENIEAQYRRIPKRNEPYARRRAVSVDWSHDPLHVMCARSFPLPLNARCARLQQLAAHARPGLPEADLVRPAALDLGVARRRQCPARSHHQPVDVYKATRLQMARKGEILPSAVSKYWLNDGYDQGWDGVRC